MAKRNAGRFQAMRTPDGWAYALRPADRVPGQIRCVGDVASPIALIVLPLAFGLGLIGLLLWGIPGPGRDMLALPFFAVVLVPIVISATLVFFDLLRQRSGRDELRIDARSIRSTWRLGPFARTTTVPRSGLVQFTVVLRARGQPGPERDGRSEYHALTAEDADGRRQTLVAHYPREFLLALADELATRSKALWFDPDLGAFDAAKAAVGEDSEVPTDVRERRDRPRGTRLAFERVGVHGVRIAQPPGCVTRAVCAACLLAGVALLACAAATAG
jgi:hypothetical protein